MEKNSKFKRIILSNGGYIGMIVILYIIIWGIMVALTATDSMVIALIYVALFTYFGWLALNKITPQMFVWMPLKGWIIYFVVKFILSIIVGMFVAPFQIAKKITAAVQNSIK